MTDGGGAKPPNRRPDRREAKLLARRGARLFAVQALYQLDVGGQTLPEVMREFEDHRIGREIEGVAYPDADIQHFRRSVEGVVGSQLAIDRAIEDTLKAGWTLGRLDTTLRAMLRVSAFEMMFREDIPPAVVIDEYVELARAFFDGEEPALVHALLDSLARSHRSQ